ncbi:MAG TPA: epoxyqueuosine reductase QueH [Mogibacterium sp.]|nr:epoxyqueuosine reductase QueH [Mogibacterium sp.]
MKKTIGTTFLGYCNGNSDLLEQVHNPAVKQIKPTLLLHACCGPCTTACVERLAKNYDITVYYYNPNITDKEEYRIRRETLIQFINIFNKENKGICNINYLEGPYEPERYLIKTKNNKTDSEGGPRCSICFHMRMEETASKASELGIDYFTTTLSVSPHKNYEIIRTIGAELEKKYKTKFLDIDFKKKNGFGRSVEISKEYGLYRQNFCGCEYTRYSSDKDRKKI